MTNVKSPTVPENRPEMVVNWTIDHVLKQTENHLCANHLSDTALTVKIYTELPNTEKAEI